MMIKKLPINNYSTPIEEKINEIIDTIYDMQLAISNLDPDSEWYDGNHIADTSKKVDHYAEQKKWIGRLCRFWDDNFKTIKCLGVLTRIDETAIVPYEADNGFWYCACEPVKPDDDVIFKE